MASSGSKVTELSGAPVPAPSGFFVLRAPRLPLESLDGAPGAHGTEAGRARLRAWLDRPAVREAVFVASPSLEAQIGAWEKDPDSEAGRKVEQALTRYASRMAGRATPFGLFAGCSVGTIERSTRLTVGEPCRRHTRLDMDYIVLLADALSRDPALRESLRFRPNSSLYRVAGRARYREVRRDGKGWSHRRAVLEVPDYLESVLAGAAGGATPKEIHRVLLGHDPEATEAEAAEYVADLIDQQVLVSELVPAVTGEEPVFGLVERLRQLPAGAAAAERLAWVRDELAAIDAAPEAPRDRYRAVARKLAEFGAPVDEARLFQVDLARPDAQSSLGANVVSELLRGVEVLRRITPRPAEDPLEAFRRAFSARFGDTPMTREVPLAEALDEETGVGFGEGAETVEASSLLEGLDLARPVTRRIPWGPAETHLLSRVTEALARGEPEIVLTEKDVERMAAPDALPLPDAFAAIARLEAPSDEAVARGDFRLLLGGASGPSGARLLGRFCHGDPSLAEAVSGHLRAEEALRPDAVFAEIVHLPEGRVGNILLRPASRAYEIPYLGRSGAPVEHQIPLSDLLVSVRGERVVLRSARLGQEVLPRLTSAHNYIASSGVYRFLCSLQTQGVAGGLSWEWGPLDSSAFLPRVVCGRVVLARAQWSVPQGLLPDAEAVRRWRDERRVPRWICLAEGDHELPIDLDDALMVETLLDGVRSRERTTLVEMFPAPDRLCATGPGGRYTHEIVVPFVRTGAPAVRVPTALPTSPARRVVPPGAEWLSVKLYAGPLVVDHLVRDGIAPLAESLGADRWFFVRYADPHGHLRVRFHGEQVWGAFPVLQEAVAPLLEEGRIWKVQLDTYEREIERYGGPAGIGPCERLFHADSVAAVELVGASGDDGRGDRRWRFALLAMDRMLDDLGLGLEEKLAVVRRARDGDLTSEARVRVGAKYRAEAKALAEMLGGGEGWEEPRAILDRRSRAAATAVEELRGAGVSVSDLAPSLLHMHCNRLLRSAQTTQEAVLEDFLCRRYEGLLARR